MSPASSMKVGPDHLARTAYLYLRQSTLRQVVNNTELATPQYALRQRGRSGLDHQSDRGDRL